MPVSFYDLDYIIQINEKRLEEFTSLYHKASKNGKSASAALTTTNSKLPGLENVHVIISRPLLIKENSSKVTEK